ncbi:MAG: DUF262 domain-containing protein [Myxococcaceae bacterium]|jgi:hypothetical protein|nr:DUF262 domain-containing protein [Myxococcaceae bacterium]
MTAKLRTRPKVTTVKVDQLLQWAQKGLLRLPQFQRPLRWRPSDFVDLFDSVYRGFPIGTVLLAEQRWEQMETRLGPFVATSSPTEAGYSIIDGQQRITTLVGTLLHPVPEPVGDSYSLYFDLEAETFFVRTRRRSLPETAIPLRALRSMTTTLAWTRSWRLAAERPDLVERADQLAQSVREFELAAAVVDGGDERTLRDIFVRTNRAGVSLQANEVFEALHATTPETSLAAAIARLGSAGFDTLDGDFFLRCLLHVGEFDPGADLRSVAVQPALLTKAETAILEAMAFLRADCEVEDIDSLPQVFPVLPLAGFFSRFPKPGERARRLLRRWFWRGQRENEFANNGFGPVRQWQELIRAGDRDDVVASSMVAAVPDRNTTIELPTEWRKGSRPLWMLQIAFAARGRSRDDWSFEGSFVGDRRWSGCWVPLLEPKPLAAMSDDALDELGFSAEGRQLLRAYLASPSPRLLEALALQRQVELSRRTNEFLDSVCEPTASTRPSIATLLEQSRGAA